MDATSARSAAVAAHASMACSAAIARSAAISTARSKSPTGRKRSCPPRCKLAGLLGRETVSASAELPGAAKHPALRPTWPRTRKRRDNIIVTNSLCARCVRCVVVREVSFACGSVHSEARSTPTGKHQLIKIVLGRGGKAVDNLQCMSSIKTSPLGAPRPLPVRGRTCRASARRCHRATGGIPRSPATGCECRALSTTGAWRRSISG
eukprot:scaffold40910_cov72-Phaeocystis_antarctica.AAC.9